MPDWLPPDGLAFLARQDQALLGIEVQRVQRQRAAPAAGGLGVQAQQQRVEFRVITCGRRRVVYALRQPALTRADTTGMYSAKVGVGGVAAGAVSRSAGVRPIRSSRSSAASAWQGQRSVPGPECLGADVDVAVR